MQTFPLVFWARWRTIALIVANTIMLVAAPASQAAAQTPATIGNCTEITAPGTYKLSQSIGPGVQTSGCLNVHDISSVQIDLGGFSITGGDGPAISIINVQNFSLKNGTVIQTASSTNAGIVQVTNSSYGEFSTLAVGSLASNTLQQFQVFNSSHLSIHDNSAFYGSYSQSFSSNVTLANNGFVCPTAVACSYLVLLRSSDHNQIIGNSFNGSSPPRAADGSQGTDDAIYLWDETADVISGNSIRNLWDMGIELEGANTGMTIVGNSVQSATNVGYGGEVYFSLSNSVIAANTADSINSGFRFLRSGGLRSANPAFLQPADSQISFAGNLLASNIFTNTSSFSQSVLLHFTPAQGEYGPLGYTYRSAVAGDSLPTTIPALSQFNLAGNAFVDNDFGPVAFDFGPLSVPAGDVIDGGANSCVQNGLGTFALACQGRSPVAMTITAQVAPSGGATSGQVQSSTLAVVLKGLNLSLSPVTTPGAYSVTSPDCTIAGGAAGISKLTDPGFPSDPSHQLINFLVLPSLSQGGLPLNCTFVVTRAQDQRVAAAFVTGLSTSQLGSGQPGTGTGTGASNAGSLTIVSGSGSMSSGVSPGGLATLYFSSPISGFVAPAQAWDAFNLPVTLGSLDIRLTIGSTSWDAPLSYASTNQVNLFIPPSALLGNALVSAYFKGALVSSGSVVLQKIAPGFFTANQEGAGFVVGQVVQSNGSVSNLMLSATQPAPVIVGPTSTPTFLILYGTGWRNSSGAAQTKCIAGTVPVPVSYAGLQGQTPGADEFPGLDQLNLQLPPSLRSAGVVNLNCSFNGVAANTVQLEFSSQGLPSQPTTQQ